MLAAIIIVVIAVVVSVVTYGAASGAMSAWAAGALAGAASAAATQVAGSVMGVSSFSWKAIAAGAITGALTAGIASEFGSVGDAVKAGTAAGYVKAAGLALADAGAGYAGQKIAGMDVTFSWKNIAISAVSSVVGAKLAPKIESELHVTSNFGKALTESTVAGMVSAELRHAINHEDIDYVGIAADAFGNALGNAAGMRLVDEYIAPGKAEAAERRKQGTVFATTNPFATAQVDAAVPQPSPFGTFNDPFGAGASFFDANPQDAAWNAFLARAEGANAPTFDIKVDKSRQNYYDLYHDAGYTNPYARQLDTIVVTPNEEYNRWYASVQAWAKQVHQAPPPLKGGWDALSRYVQTNTAKYAPAYNAYVARARQGDTVSLGVARRAPTDAEFNDWMAGQTGKVFGRFTEASVMLGGLPAAATLSPVVGAGLAGWSVGSGASDIADGHYIRGTLEIVGGLAGLGVAASEIGSASSLAESVWMPLGPNGMAGERAELQQLMSDPALTFRPQGVSEAEAMQYLRSPDGKNLYSGIWASNPNLSPEEVLSFALQDLKAGSELPTLEVRSSGLVKLVPEGEEVSDYSPFFTTEAEVQRALASDRSIADYFGLPISREAPTYSLFGIEPLQPAGVFSSPIARTEELGGLQTRAAGAIQYIVPNRTLWSDPVFLRLISK
jgi:hypothetical protein